MDTNDNLIRYSIFAHANDGVPKPKSSTWEEFVAGLGPHRFDVVEKLRCHMFTPAEFSPGAKSRSKENVVRVWLWVMDLDGITYGQLLPLCEKLETLDAVLYTTWRHAETYQGSLTDPLPERRGLWKIRVCIRLSRPVEAAEWPSFWLATTAYFDGLNDPACKDACHCYFGAFAPPGTPPELCHFIVFKGDPLDVDQMMEMAAATPPPAGHQKVPRERLKKIAARWKKAKNYYRSEMGDVLMHIFHGEAFAEPGNRDNLLFQLCSDLAKELPEADPESVAELFAPSLQMSGPDAPTVESVREKFERAQTNAASEAAAEERSANEESKLRIREAFAHLDPERDYPYTEPELDAMATELRCSRPEMMKRFLIQRATLFYVLGPGAVYSAAYAEREALNAVVRDLAPASSAGVDLWIETEKDRIRKSITQLMSDYGSVAGKYVLDLTAQKASYNPGLKQFTEAPCPLRPLIPAFNDKVDRWLQLLAGPEHCPNVQNWLAHVTDLDLTCAALVVTGPPGTGKSLLAYGVSRLWTEDGPTKATSALADFNDSISRCPLVLADEKLPCDFRGRPRTAELREFISDRSRSYKKKYAPEVQILGSPRLFVTANRDDILATEEDLVEDDIEALAERFYLFRARPEAAEYLRTVDTNEFVAGDAIARHVLWLKDNHPKHRDGRFILKPKDLGIYVGLATGTGLRSNVLHWLTEYLLAPNKLGFQQDYGIRIKSKTLLVNARSVLKNWTVYLPDCKVPSIGRLGHAIAGLSVREEEGAKGAKGRKKAATPHRKEVQYRQINTQFLYEYANQTDIMTSEEIDEALSIDTVVPPYSKSSSTRK